MIEIALTKKSLTTRAKASIKLAISTLIVLLAVTLPQIVHLTLGSSGGSTYLPMYLPVLLGGALLGIGWGLGIGVVSPLVSFVITFLFGNPMPALTILPFMCVELAIWGLVSGCWSKAISKNGWLAIPAVISAMLLGRLIYLLTIGISSIFGLTSMNFASAWAAIETSYKGLIIQAVIVPFIIMGLRYLLIINKKINRDE